MTNATLREGFLLPDEDYQATPVIISELSKRNAFFLPRKDNIAEAYATFPIGSELNSKGPFAAQSALFDTLSSPATDAHSLREIQLLAAPTAARVPRAAMRLRCLAGR
jgi:hypothetical protein